MTIMRLLCKYDFRLMFGVMKMTDNGNKKSILLKFVLFSIAEVLLYAIIMLVITFSLSKINNLAYISDNTYVNIFIVVSAALGLVTSFILIRKIFKRKNTNTGLYLIFMVIVHALIFWILYISGLDYINRIVELLNSDGYLHDIFYNEYFYESIIFRISYDEWKNVIIDQINSFIPQMKQYAKTLSFIFVCSSYVGVILEMMFFKIQTRFKLEIKSIE